MKAYGKVLSVNEKYAKVVTQRNSACSSCHSCKSSGSCHAELVFGKQTEDVVIDAVNVACANVGDMVELASSTRKTLSVIATIFVLPVLFSLISYIVVLNFTESDFIPVIFLLCVFIFSFIALVKLMNIYAKKYLKAYIVRIVKESGN